MAVTPSAQYSVTIRVEMESAQPGLLGALTTAIGEVGGDIGAIDLVGAGHSEVVREIVVNASDQEHADAIVAA
ncbi:MAG: NAD-dependent malic enzyme, partial [Thermoleophilia bacterium]